MFTDVMLDLETMGVGPTAAIIAIGAVAFNMNEPGEARFYATVELKSSMAGGGTVDASTILWWMGQDDAARAEFIDKSLAPSPVPIGSALYDFSDFMTRTASGAVHVWGNGSDFDNVILRGAYERLGLAAPWGFRANRCYRTAMALLDPNKVSRMLSKTSGTKHHALDDALYQVECLKWASKRGVDLG